MAAMTMEERVQAVEALGFLPRQAGFLATVALHSGYCLRRHYTAFTETKTGKNVQRFLESLVVRQLAQKTRYRVDRGYVYHLHAWPLYRAIGHPNDRNRLQLSAAAIARRMMLLDVVLSEPAVEWIATEADKVALFTKRFQVPLHALPRRTILPAGKTVQASRYFRDKLPIGLEGDPLNVRFVYLATDANVAGFEHFLRDHARLVSALPAWTMTVVHPQRVTSSSSWASAFERFVSLSAATEVPFAELERYFRVRRFVERQDFAAVTVDDLRNYRHNRARFGGPAIEALFAHWLASGEDRLDPTMLQTRPVVPGRLVIQPLTHRYEQFGAYAGLV
jgi:hypothetical protein